MAVYRTKTRKSLLICSALGISLGRHCFTAHAPREISYDSRRDSRRPLRPAGVGAQRRPVGVRFRTETPSFLRSQQVRERAGDGSDAERGGPSSRARPNTILALTTQSTALDIFSTVAGKSASSSGRISWGKGGSAGDDADDFVVLATESDPLVPLTIFTTTMMVACASYICSGVNTGALLRDHPIRLASCTDFSSMHESCLSEGAGAKPWIGSSELVEEMSVRRETVAEGSFTIPRKQQLDEATAPVCVLPLRASQIDEGHTSIVYLGHELRKENDAASGVYTVYQFLVEAVDARTKTDVHRRRRRIRWLIASKFCFCGAMTSLFRDSHLALIVPQLPTPYPRTLQLFFGTPPHRSG